MNRHCLRPLVWLPLLAAAAVFAAREAAGRPAPLSPLVARAVELPPVQTPPAQRNDLRYELDAPRSMVRFLVEGSGGELLVACPVVSGTLVLFGNDRGGELELRLDLGSLVPIGDPASTIDLRHLLGVHRGSEIVYRATLASTATCNLPAVVHRLWMGTLRFGNRVVRQPMGLWQTALPGQPLRLQGHGTVGTEAYGLPKRTWLGLVREHHVVTLGLDLAWKRKAR